MSVQNQLNQMLDVAVRNQDSVTRTLLRTVLGNAQTISRRTGDAITDALIVKIVKDFIAGNLDTLKLRDNPALVKENEILNTLLPKQMSEDEVLAAIHASNASNIGDVMKFLTANYAGLYNGKQASAMANQWLASKG